MKEDPISGGEALGSWEANRKSPYVSRNPFPGRKGNRNRVPRHTQASSPIGSPDVQALPVWKKTRNAPCHPRR